MHILKTSLLVAAVQSLHVIQILDSVILEMGEFITLSNFNDANAFSQNQQAFNQSIEIAITNNFENFQYDVFVFEVDEETGKSQDFECYRAAVFTKLWNTDCNFGAKTQIITGQEKTTQSLKSVKDSNDKDKIVVIDNTPLPSGGASARDSIVLEYSVSSTFNMAYNLRNVSIVMGIISMIVSFAIGSLTYLAFKIRKDIQRKFLSDDEEEEEEEAEEETNDESNMHKVSLN